MTHRRTSPFLQFSTSLYAYYICGSMEFVQPSSRADINRDFAWRFLESSEFFWRWSSRMSGASRGVAPGGSTRDIFCNAGAGAAAGALIGSLSNGLTFACFWIRRVWMVARGSGFRSWLVSGCRYGFAGAIAATFVCPLDVIKTRLQVHGAPSGHQGTIFLGRCGYFLIRMWTIFSLCWPRSRWGLVELARFSCIGHFLLWEKIPYLF